MEKFEGLHAKLIVALEQEDLVLTLEIHEDLVLLLADRPSFNFARPPGLPVRFHIREDADEYLRQVEQSMEALYRNQYVLLRSLDRLATDLGIGLEEVILTYESQGDSLRSQELELNKSRFESLHVRLVSSIREGNLDAVFENRGDLSALLASLYRDLSVPKRRKVSDLQFAFMAYWRLLWRVPEIEGLQASEQE